MKANRAVCEALSLEWTLQKETEKIKIKKASNLTIYCYFGNQNCHLPFFGICLILRRK